LVYSEIDCNWNETVENLIECLQSNEIGLSFFMGFPLYFERAYQLLDSYLRSYLTIAPSFLMNQIMDK